MIFFVTEVEMLEAPEEDLEINGTDVRVKGVASLKTSFAKVAHAVAGTPGYALPDGIDPGMEASRSFLTDDLTYVNGTVAVEVEVDPETGHVLILKYVIVHDCGTVINPMIVDGQVVGGTAHGIGNSLFEWMGYDENAQPITTKGFVVMDTAGYDPASITGMVAGGANMLVFTTGRGSCFGCKPVPCIKVSTNTTMYEHMIDDMDLNAGTILEGASVADVGHQLFEQIIEVASGQKTKSELTGVGEEEFAPWGIGPTL